jgi:hypothetical protein
MRCLAGVYPASGGKVSQKSRFSFPTAKTPGTVLNISIWATGKRIAENPCNFSEWDSSAAVLRERGGGRRRRRKEKEEED